MLACVEGGGVAVSACGDAPGAAPGVDDLAAVEGVVLVTDLTEDPRFASGAWARLVPGALALALAPVPGGVLAVLDCRPRAWTADDAELLADLAATAAEGQDVTAEEALRASEERYRTLFEKAGEAIFIVEPDAERVGRIVEVNAAACAMHGYTPEELRSVGLAELVVPERSATVREHVRHIAAGGWLALDAFHLRKDGSRFPVEGVVGPLDVGGKRYLLAIVRDVTEQRRGVAALAAANQQLACELAERQRAESVARAVVDNFPGIVIAFDHERRVTMAGGARADLLAGVPAEGTNRWETLGAGMMALYEPLCGDALRGTITRLERTPGDAAFDVQILPLPGQDGAIIGGMAVVQDITLRVAAASALRASEERYRLLFERAPEGIFIVEATGERAGAIVDANAAACAMHGYTREEMLALKITDLLAPEHLPQVPERSRRAGAGEWFAVETLRRRKDGSRFPVEGVLGPLDVGDKRYVLAFFHDVTERRGAADALAAANAQLARELAERQRAETLARAVLRNFPDGAVLLFGHDMRFMMAGGSHLDRMGSASIVGKTLHETRPPATAAIFEPLYRDALRGKTTTVERVAEGRTYDVQVLPVTQEDGVVMAGMVVARDVTGRAAAEAALRDAKDAAEAANRAKSAFLASMSHEIRTPMNAILGYTQLLQRDPSLGPRQQQQLEIIGRSGDHLLALINDVLEMSKIEAGHRTLTRGVIELGPLIDDLARMFRLRADAKRLAFATIRQPDLPRLLLGDEGKLRQVLVNLLGNAVKFTEEGGVTVRVRAEGPSADELRLTVEVTDTGPGISAEEIEGLFQPFAQARAGLRSQGGTGLGLAISREFARMMGGDITVESRVGAGSTFRLDFPLEVGTGGGGARPAPRRTRVLGLAAGQPPPRVLVVDDSEDNRTWLRDLLLEVGFEVREAEDGAVAVACFIQWRPALVLMDMNMPVMDGYAATRAIRALPQEPPTAVVAVTALAFDEARDAIFAAGAVGWLRKPCREAEVLEEIRRHLGIEYRYAPASSPAAPLSPRPQGTLGELPPGVRAELIAAARIADYEQLHRLCDELTPEHARAADELRRMVERYAYDKIEVLLRSAPAG